MTPADIRKYMLRDMVLRQSVTLPDALPPYRRIRAVHPERGAML